MENYSLDKLKVTEGFFYDLLERNANVTVKSVYRRFKETGRFDALNLVKTEPAPHIFWDSDVAKWLEAAAYLLSRNPDEEIRAWYEQAVKAIVKNQREDGYFNSYFQIYEPDAIFSRRTEHELYCAGHLFEAGIAASQYLGDDRLLKFSEKFADYIYERFYVKKDTVFTTPGHEEIELALVKLYKHTEKEKYLTLARFFINERGQRDEDEYGKEENNHYISQSEMPLRKLAEAEGHAVRLIYLLCGMADVAVCDGDDELMSAVQKVTDDILNHKLYVTGGVGSSYAGEKFTVPYDLPNEFAYSETCASIALMLLADRLIKADGNVKHADLLERAFYNCVLAGVSLSGDKFFYVNPLEVNESKISYNEKIGIFKDKAPLIERVKVFFCSCCPPNVCRIIEQLPSYAFYHDENSLTVCQYMSVNLESEFVNAKMQSGFPYDGKVKLQLNSHGKRITVKLRKPAWCDRKFDNETDGFLIFEGVYNDDFVEVEFPMKIKTVYPNPNIDDDANKIALSYGPLILCAEGVDNGALSGLSIGDSEKAKTTVDKNSPSVLKVTVPATEKIPSNELYGYEKPKTVSRTITFIPYFAWANRGRNDMKIWFPEA